MNSPTITLFIGGARSGKSSRAQAFAESMGTDAPGRLIYLATAQAFDDEMRDRIARHQADRDARWRTVECPVDLAAAVRTFAVAGHVVLIDCLTLWTSNLLLAGDDIDGAGTALITALGAAQCPVIIVSNEVGMGIVPDNALARAFRDVAGRLNQRIAAAATNVHLMVAGLMLTMK